MNPSPELPKNDKRFGLHRPLAVGTRVQVRRGFYMGTWGTVEELLSTPDHLELTGLVRLAVRFDDGRLLDYARFEVGTVTRDERRAERARRADLRAMFQRPEAAP